MKSGLDLYRRNRLLTDDWRGLEAEIFRRVAYGLQHHRAGGVQLAHAVADARNLWTAVQGLVSDEANRLPFELRQNLGSLARTLLTEMVEPVPQVDIDMLIAATTSVAEGLEGKP